MGILSLITTYHGFVEKSSKKTQLCIFLRKKRPRTWPLYFLLSVPEGVLPGFELQFLIFDADGGIGGDGMGDEDIGSNDAVPADHRFAA